MQSTSILAALPTYLRFHLRLELVQTCNQIFFNQRYRPQHSARALISPPSLTASSSYSPIGQFDLAQPGFLDMDALKIGSGKIGFTEIGPRQVCTAEVGIAQVCAG